MPFVSSSIYLKALALAESEGLQTNNLHDHPIDKTQKYLAIERLFEVYEAANEQLKPGFGLRQGKQLELDDYGTLGLSWKTCWRLKDVLERTERYMLLVTDLGHAEIKEEQATTELIFHREPKRVGLALANEASLVMLHQVIERVGKFEIRPIEVHLQHGNQAAAQAFEDHFQAPVYFESNKNAIRFPSADLNRPTSMADKSLQAFLMERMEEEKAGIESQADGLLKKISEIVEESLPSGIPTLIQLSENLNMSARTLKRRLSDKEISFRELVQNIQKEQAEKLLKEEEKTISEIAFLTGFSEQSAFHRAFKRWYNQSPSDFRNSL